MFLVSNKIETSNMREICDRRERGKEKKRKEKYSNRHFFLLVFYEEERDQVEKCTPPS